MNKTSAIGLIKAAGILPPGALSRFGELLTGSRVAANKQRISNLAQALPSLGQQFRGPIMDKIQALQDVTRPEQTKVLGTRLGTGAGALGADYAYQKGVREPLGETQAPFSWQKFISGNADDIGLALKNFVE